MFYRDASFFSAAEVEQLLLDSGFTIENWAQTRSKSLSETHEIEAVRTGRGQYAFVVVVATRGD